MLREQQAFVLLCICGGALFATWRLSEQLPSSTTTAAAAAAAAAAAPRAAATSCSSSLGQLAPSETLDQKEGKQLWEQAEPYLAEVQYINGLRQFDDRLLRIIRRRFLVAPPPHGTPYQLQDPSVRDPSMGQASAIRTIFNGKRGGFFVECGALDGETRSNTLQLERQLGWHGLLVEADPLNFRAMLRRHRHAWLAPVCLSLEPRPTRVSFMQFSSRGRIFALANEGSAAAKREGYVDVQCLPLTSLLLAMNRTSVDYFSLDVEGHELEVLMTIPFHLIDIKALSVEYIHGKDGKQALRDFMEGRGYRVHSEVTAPNNWANDFIFVKTRQLLFDGEREKLVALPAAEGHAATQQRQRSSGAALHEAYQLDLDVEQ